MQSMQLQYSTKERWISASDADENDLVDKSEIEEVL